MKEFTDYYVQNDEALDMLREYHSYKCPMKKEKQLEKIINKLSYMISSRIKGYRHRVYYGDLFQEGKIGLICAVNEFDTNRGINFFKYASWRINTHISKYLRWNKRSTKVLNNYDINFVTPQEEVETLEEEDILLKAINSLPFLDREVILLRNGIDCKRHTMREIANILGVTYQYINIIEKRAINKIKKKIGSL